MPKRDSNDPNDRRDQETANWCSAKNRHRVLKLVSQKIASYRMIDLISRKFFRASQCSTLYTWNGKSVSHILTKNS